ncbi:cupin domain-containing protein [Streptomyces albidus (ex Kaewkla and Franco 2022)]|uniref:cupin domain-containing protein n=1 Tax=Streptomyces albidus (ex Kaewkla and Franco 2022) TaxID=722709 RepID=UPI0015EF8DEB|nr:cupin domain-containing protein [Streptomyces albidus (ex Kaewkla and Franco 2022)]
MTPTQVDLFASALHFHQDGEVRADERQMTGSASGAWQIGVFHVETDADVHADHWEMHPHAEEAVCCLTGGVRLYLRPVEGEDAENAEAADELVRLTAGTAVIVPRGRWHRLELEGPSDLMSVTLRQGTRLEKRAGTT